MMPGIVRKSAIAMLAGTGLWLAGIQGAWAGAEILPHLTAIAVADDDEGPSDPGTAESDEMSPDRPGIAPPSEDDTQQEARPLRPGNEPPQFGGCLFEKRDLGLII